MKKKITLTTSNSIEGKEIEEYLDIVSTQIVIGTNILSDIKASFSDFFGGHSGTYQRKLQAMIDEAKLVLKEKARSMFADAVIGIHFDTSSISAKEMSMLMMVVSGTAVRLKDNNINKNSAEQNSNYVSLNQLNDLLLLDYINSDDFNRFPEEEEWDVITRHRNTECLTKLVRMYFERVVDSAHAGSESKLLFIERFPAYLACIEDDCKIPAIYDYFETAKRWQPIAEFIKEQSLLNLEYVKRFINLGFVSSAVELLSADKSEYERQDLGLLQEIAVLVKEKIEPNIRGQKRLIEQVDKFYQKVDMLQKIFEN